MKVFLLVFFKIRKLFLFNKLAIPNYTADSFFISKIRRKKERKKRNNKKRRSKLNKTGSGETK